MSTAPAEPRPIPSDARLVWMASERAAPLFRTLDRARGFGPLVVLMAILPAAVVVLTASCSHEDAAVGLLALDAVGVPVPAQAVRLVRDELAGVSLRPAAVGISGEMMRLLGPARGPGILAASLLGGMALIAVLWWFVQLLGRSQAGKPDLRERRLAFWVVILAAFHPAVVRLLICPVPVSLALAGLVGALAAYLSLSVTDKAPGGYGMIWRVLVLAGGIAAALLIAGSAALIGVAVVVIDAVGCWLFASGETGRGRPPRAAYTPATLLGLRLLGAGLGLVLWLVLDGMIPAISWDLSAGESGELARQTSWFNIVDWWDSAEFAVGPLWGLALIGIWRFWRLTKRSSGNRRRANGRLLLIWLAAAVGLVLWNGPVLRFAFDPTARFVTAGAVLPLLIAAALAIEEAARRAVGGAWILLAILLPMAIRLGEWIAVVSIENPWRWLLAGVLVLAVGWICYLILRAIVPAATQRRGMLMGVILLAVVLTAADGLRLVFGEQRSGGDMDRLLVQLREEQPRDGAALLVTGAPPVRLVFAVRGVFAEAPMEIAPSWEEAADRLDRRDAGERRLAVTWDMGESLGTASPEPIRPAGDPLLFEGRPLLIYVSGEPGSAPTGAQD